MTIAKKGAYTEIRDTDGRTAMATAVENNHYDVVKVLIGAGADVNIPTLNKRTPLMAAVCVDNEKIAEILINERADANLKDEKGKTALYLAAQYNRIDAANRLIDKAENLDVETEAGWTPLMIASQKGHVNIVKALIDRKDNDETTAELNHENIPMIDKGVNVEKKLEAGRTALYLAVENGHTEVTNRLIEAGAELDAETNGGFTPLMTAIENGHENIGVELIGKMGLPHVNKQYKDGETALYLAAKKNRLHVVNKLIEVEAALNTTTNSEWTPLMIASRNGHVNVVKALADHNARLDHKDVNGQTALYTALEHERVDVAEVLIEKRADLKVQTLNGRTPLMAASVVGNEKIADTLIRKIVKLNKKDKTVELNEKDVDGKTALYLAAENDHPRVVDRLIETEGVDLNAETSDGWTPLMIAIEKGHENIAKRLIYKGADVKWKLPNRRTALYLAAENGSTSVANKLIGTERTDLNAETSDGWTPMMIAPQNGHESIVKFLIQQGADITKRLPGGRTSSTTVQNGQVETGGLDAFAIAVHKGHVNIINALIEKADVNGKDKNGKTPLIVASENGHSEIVDILLEKGAKVNEEWDEETALTLARDEIAVERSEISRSYFSQFTPIVRQALKSRKPGTDVEDFLKIIKKECPDETLPLEVEDKIREKFEVVEKYQGIREKLLRAGGYDLRDKTSETK